MALGDNTNKQNGFYTPTTLSGYVFSNSKADMEKSQLYFEFWNGFLKISIAPLKAIDQNGVASFDKERSISIYMKSTKALILLKEIEEFEKNPDAYKNMGVNSGKGLISISNGKEFGYTEPCLIIRRINDEGVTEASTAYVFRNDFHFSVRDYNEETHNFDSVYDGYQLVELEMIKTLLQEYIKASTSAIAGDLISKTNYMRSRDRETLEAVAAKLGVDFPNRSKGTKSNGSFFNKNANPNSGVKVPEYTPATIDDIDSL